MSIIEVVGDIIQGDDKPIVVSVPSNVTSLQKLSAVLTRGNKIYKHWAKTDVTIGAYNSTTNKTPISFPLSQEDTIAITSDYVDLEIKCLLNSTMYIYKKVRFNVAYRSDKTILEV